MSRHLEHITKRASSDPYYYLGQFGRTISTESDEAQIWFNRGLTWTYCFNHEEACKCFEQTIVHDSACAMGYWGLAYASGPNYNKTWARFDKRDLQKSIFKCHVLCKDAIEHLHGASPAEQALIQALQSRFPVNHTDNDFSSSEVEYATAMREV
jgi:hypothetical protein